MAVKTKKTQLSDFEATSEGTSLEKAARDIAKGVTNSVKNELFEKSISTAWKRLLGDTSDMADFAEQHAGNVAQMSGDLSEGEEINLSKTEWARVEPGINYKSEILHAETRILRQENRTLEAKVEQIIMELKKLSKSSKQLEVTFKDVAVETLPASPGKYHLSFFEWVLTTIQEARVKIESSTAWLNAVGHKKNKKDYWSLSKKHGTSFQLSGERSVAQSTG
jgi:hypothetical protein